MRRIGASVILAVLCGCGDGGATRVTTGATTGGTSAGETTAATPTTSGEPGTTGGLDGSSSSDGTTAMSGGSSGEPPSACDMNAACFGPGSCTECSLGDRCGDEFTACMATPNDACTKYSQCVTACAGDPQCIQSCYVQFPDGYDPAWALHDCGVCDSCPTSCSAYAEYCALGGGPGKTGTCDDLGDCVACTSCSAGGACAAAVQACTAEPQCQPYQQCVAGCAEGDKPCLDACEMAYPAGYAPAWAQFDCGVCTACPASCAAAQSYCQAGGGGPHSECVTNADCLEISDSLPFCVGKKCVECLTDDNCLFDAIVCQNNFCV